ncbi:unnamed protein product [Rotaria sp. Silwood2]|nr:unnamed protein product [Rotaria sp. Silwood2]
MQQQKRPGKSIKSYFPVKKPRAESPSTPTLVLLSTTIDTSTHTSALLVINSSTQSDTSSTVTLPASTQLATLSTSPTQSATLPTSPQSATSSTATLAILPTSTQSATSSTSSQSATSSTAILPTQSATSPTDISHSKNEPPSQPVLSSYVQNSDKRSFQSQWFKDRPWLEFSVIQNKAYCYYCRHYGTSKLTTKSQCNAFLKGFYNWRKALDSKSGFKQHESSEGHLQATTNYQEYLLRFNTQTCVINVLYTGRSQQIKRNRDRISKIASAFFIVCQTNDSIKRSNNRGNLLEILSWSSETDPTVKSIMENETTKLKKWSSIRWDSRWSSIDSIIKNYRAILKALNDLIDDGDARSADANGLLIAFKEPLFIITLFVIHKILGPIKILSNQLQDESLDFGAARELISSIIEQMKSYRNNSSFESLYSKVAQFCTENQIDISQKPRQRRQKKVPAHFNDCIATLINGHRDYADNEEQYRTTIYYSLIDSVLIELNHRFSSETMKILISISSLCPKNEKFLDFEILKPFALNLDINPDMLKNELNVLRPMLKNKRLLDLKELYCELIPFVRAFPNVVLMYNQSTDGNSLIH